MSPKDIESLLRERLSAGSSRPLPSPGFEERVRRSLTAQVGSHRRAHALEALVGLAAVLALAVVALPWLIGPRPSGVGGPGGSASAGTSAGGSASAGTSAGASSGSSVVESSEPSLESPATASGPALKRGTIWDWSFDYPSDWAVQDHRDAGYAGDVNNSPINPALGTIGPVSEDCPSTGTDNLFTGCSATWDLVPSSAAITFEFNEMSGGPDDNKTWNLLDAEMSTPPAATRVVSVAGVRALFARGTSDRLPLGTTIVFRYSSIPGADEVLVWEMVDRFDSAFGFKITAAIRGPDVARLDAQVQAIVASMSYVPAITPLPTDAASKKAALTSDIAAWTDRFSPSALACFSGTPGATTSATITETLSERKLSRPLAVRCTTQVDILPEQVWKVTFIYEWDATAGHASGKAEFVDVGGIAQDSFDQMPYILPVPQGNG